MSFDLSPFSYNVYYTPYWITFFLFFVTESREISYYKREKVANLLFDLVKYLLTALGAMLLFTDKNISTGIVVIIALLATLVFIFGIFITPLKED